MKTLNILNRSEMKQIIAGDREADGGPCYMECRYGSGGFYTATCEDAGQCDDNDGNYIESCTC